MKLKKAAMFGLDARIALAIFGALSVISGAALYSAIQQANVIKYITQIEEISKAYESYRLDTGSDIETKYGAQINIEELISSTKPGWSGPYTSLSVNDNGTSAIFFDYGGGKRIYIDSWVEGVNDTWGWDATTPVGPNACTVTSCYLYFSINNLSTGMVEAVDAYIDGSISPQTGKVRRWGDNKFYYIANRKM